MDFSNKDMVSISLLFLWGGEMIEQKIVIDGCECFYLRKSGRYDTKHLVVVFSGFSGDGKPTYNYQNTLEHCPADVLWIKDFFKGGESYYLCACGVMDIEPAIYNLITKTLNELNLTKDDCTILGGSKGGSAALYYGMKYDFKNIISTVPQFHIGTYVEQDWLYAFRHMMGDNENDSIKKMQIELDKMIVSQIKNSNPNKNIYLITSLGDPQYKTEIENNLSLLRRFNNFNCIYANSALIQRHNQVNRHILPVTLSILTLTTMGLLPRFYTGDIKYRSIFSEGVGYLKPIASLHQCCIKDKKIYLVGDAYITGVPCPEYDDLYAELVLKNEKESYSFKLAKGTLNTDKNDVLHNKAISYRRGEFCTPKYDGLFIDELPIGRWSIYMKINARGIIREVLLHSDNNLNINGDGSSKRLSLYCIDNNVFINVEAIE